MPDGFSRFDAVVLADGLYPSGGVALSILKRAGRVICCDGAADSFIARGGEPVAIVGDCDSLGTDTVERYAHIIHRLEDQETNDQTKAVNFALARGWNRIAVLGATGKREDHTIGNVSLLAEYMSEAEVTMATDYGVFTAMKGEAKFDSAAGQQVSVFAIDPLANVEYDGLKYPSPGGHLRSWWNGTLNESLGDSFSVSSDGTAIVYRVF